MNLTINGKAIKKQTLIILGLIAGGAITSQFAAVNHFLSYHPRLEPIGSFVLMGIALLHDPNVDRWIFQQTVQTPTTTTDTTITVASHDPTTTPIIEKAP
jgi:hypothetical protein